MMRQEASPRGVHGESSTALHQACLRLIERYRDAEARPPPPPPPRQAVLEEGRLMLNEYCCSLEDHEQDGCMSWIRDQNAVSTAAAQDGLAFAIEFLDARPEGGGLIRFGVDAAGRLRYSCDGVLRPPFARAVWGAVGREGFLSFPEIDRGVMIVYGKHAAEVLLPSLRTLFDEAGVAHNVPSDAELVLKLVATECSSACFHSPRLQVGQRLHALRETHGAKCTLFSGCDPNGNVCAVM